MSEVVKCENVVEFLARPAPPDADPVRGALLSNGKYVRSNDWDKVCDYLGKPEHRIEVNKLKTINPSKKYGGK